MKKKMEKGMMMPRECELASKSERSRNSLPDYDHIFLTVLPGFQFTLMSLINVISAEFYINHGNQSFFSVLNHHRCLS